MSSTPTGSTGNIVVHVFGRTDVGRTREHNEDAFVVADLTADNATLQPEVRTHTPGPKGSLFMVADGMGGAAAGEIASAMAVEVVLGQLRTAWMTSGSSDPDNFVRALKQAAKTANEQIHAYAAAHPEYRGMGTTATIAGLLGDTLYLAQVGDSRAYIVRDGVARQITKDQSLMQKLIEAGELTEEEAEHSERRNIILQALGPEASIKIDLTHQTVRRGDALVLCSDGLSGQVSKDDIASVVTKERDLTNACRELIDRANSNGGPDNITVIVARFDGPGLVGPGSQDHVGHKVFPLQDTGQTPAMPMDRLIEDKTPTQPVPIAERPRPTGPAVDLDAANRPTERTTPMAESYAPVESSLQVSPERRNKGRMIAITLLAVLIAASAWYVFSQVKSTTAPATPTAPSK